jgi:hypothetical protein
MIAEVLREREAAAPREGPVREGRVRVAGLLLHGMPERQHFVREVEPERRETRRRTQPGVPLHEGAMP